MKKNVPEFQAMEEEDHLRAAAVPQAFDRISAIEQLLAQNLPAPQHNQLVAERNTLVLQINKYRSDKQWPEQLKKSRSQFNRIRERYLENLLDARKTANELEERWRELETDEEFKRIAEELGDALKQAVTAGPSRTFRKMISDLEKLEGNVMSDVIPLQSSGGNTFNISVTINGKTTVEMVLDSGAGIISLPAATAAEIGVAATNTSPDIQLVLADGRTVTAKLVSIPLVRVGRFEAKEVDAAILPAELTNAEPLLGMSFLKNFQFKVDSDAKTLTMSEVGIANEGATKGGKSNGRDKKK
jgi:aspartyl protease family protein